MTISMPSISYVVIFPELLLAGAAIALLAATALVRGRLPRMVGTIVVVVAAVGVLVDCIVQWSTVAQHGPSTTAANAIASDGFAIVATGIIAISLALSILVCDGWLERAGVHGVELHILALASATGAVLMAQANDLVVVFLGLEIMSIGLYVLTAFDRRSARSGEGAMKYFILGGFSSAILVYGIALVYGATGTTQLAQLSSFLAQNVLRSEGLLAAGTALLLVGFGFKVAAVPFHVWSPDVYEGAPSPVTGFMAAVVKVGAFAAALRVLSSGLFTQQEMWRPMVWALAALSMLVGAVLAASQRNVKRMLAYSSVSHAGFVLMGVWASSPAGTADALYYLAVYSVLAIGSFAVVTVVSSGGREDLSDYRGLAKRRPLLAASLTVLLLAQAGVPFTTGFLAKLAVLEGAVGHLGAAGTTLAVVAMLATAIGVYFYLRLVVLCYADASDEEAPASPSRQEQRLATVGAGILVDDRRDGDPEEHAELAGAARSEDAPVPLATAVAIGLCVVPTIVFGIWAAPLTDLAAKATMLFHP